ncbi:MAG: putative metal-binding motif-containing protein [Sandaracinaceae bacterium]|nr:putative metal-binding motif-containing protein [Sandaracinaceae bacterium]
MRASRWLLTAGLLGGLLGGCSALFDSSLPEGCMVEDFDGDGVVAPECAADPTQADCDDNDAETFPGAPELCDGFDNDCDSRFDEGLENLQYYVDCDGDSYGNDLAPIEIACATPMTLDCPGTGGGWVNRGGDCDDLNPNRQVACGSCAQVDFLIVMDTSNSMSEEQVALALQLPRVVEVLKSGDIDGDGVPEAEPITDLHVGVITPDLGSGDFNVPTCEMGFGDDGILQTTSGAPLDCRGFMIEGPPFLSFTPEEDAGDIAQFTQDWACLVRAGTGGCGFEQPLEAALKALTPAASTLRFRDDTLGHGDELNRGFLREDSILVVLVVTDEDDCSAEDPELFWPASPEYTSDLNLRCHEYADAVYPVSRYVSGLLSLRGADDLILGVVAGVPEELVPMHGIDADYGGILADSRLEERVDSASGTRLEFSCSIPGRGAAFPPRRLLELAEGLQARGSTTVLSSICSRDAYTNVAEAILSAAVEHGVERCGPRLGE